MNYVCFCKGKLVLFDQCIILQQKHIAKYYHCQSCGCVIVPDAAVWLDEAYNIPPKFAHDIDIGRFKRNQIICQKIKDIVAHSKNLAPIVDILDFGASAYRLIEKEFLHSGSGDSHHKIHVTSYDKYVPEISMLPQGREFHFIVAVEVIEHIPFDQVVKFFRFVFSRAPVLILTTGLITCKKNPPRVSQWSYYASEYGQHITMYTRDSFQWIATLFNKTLHISQIPEICNDSNLIILY